MGREGFYWKRRNNKTICMKYNLILDKKVLFTGTENECFVWIHKNTNYIFDLAMKIGYKLDEVDEEPDCDFCQDTGEIDVDETDSAGNVARGTITRKCICQHSDLYID